MSKFPLKIKLSDNFPHENLSMNPFSKPFFLEKTIIDDIFELNNQIRMSLPPVISQGFFFQFYHILGRLEPNASFFYGFIL